MSAETSLGHDYDPADQKQNMMFHDEDIAEMHIHTAAETSLGHDCDPADQKQNMLFRNKS